MIFTLIPLFKFQFPSLILSSKAYHLRWSFLPFSIPYGSDIPWKQTQLSSLLWILSSPHGSSLSPFLFVSFQYLEQVLTRTPEATLVRNSEGFLTKQPTHTPKVQRGQQKPVRHFSSPNYASSYKNGLHLIKLLVKDWPHGNPQTTQVVTKAISFSPLADW